MLDEFNALYPVARPSFLHFSEFARDHPSYFEVSRQIGSVGEKSKSATLYHSSPVFQASIYRIIFDIHRLISVNGIMCSVYPNERRGPSEEALVDRLRRFVEGSDLSFYQIASRVGTTGAILSMWLAGTARPNTTELVQIESFLKR